MEERLATLYLLTMDWGEFIIKAFNDKKFDLEAFCKTFKETFAFASQYSGADKLDRDIIEMIKVISGFVSTQFVPVSYEHLAACELTDAMLTNCFCCETGVLVDGIGKWSLLFHDEIDVDFNDPENEIFKFETEFEKWDEIASE